MDPILDDLTQLVRYAELARSEYLGGQFPARTCEALTAVRDLSRELAVSTWDDAMRRMLDRTEVKS